MYFHGLKMCLKHLLNVAGFSTVLLLTFLLSDSAGPPTYDIHDVPILFPCSAAVIPVYVPAVAGSTTFPSIPPFYGPYCVGGPVVAFIPALVCVPAVVVALLLLSSLL
jgi:hypothetical protein